MENRKDEGLKSLGKKTTYAMDYAPEVLETFTNRHPENDYWVKFNCPEFTSLCPITGQPDFAEIVIRYIPDIKMVESKSLSVQFPKPRRFSRRLREHNNEGPHKTDGPEIYRGCGTVHTKRGHQHTPLLQLRSPRNEIRTDGNSTVYSSRVVEK